MGNKIIYNFTENFTDAPGPRYRKLGDKSGQEFREDVLNNLLSQYDIIEIDGSNIKTSFNPSFLSEAFSPLYEQLGEHEFFRRIKLFSIDNPKLEEKFRAFSKPLTK
ncbi:STAS-like domain-containing protein [Campylobacter sp. faydin G-140]|uniref:STAS-like domain-containing protein n=1 Tax=Campylobacter anatolicus TaxID=2829105 RepID=UPI001B9CAEE2|nr:STAS-like domain-containing protein [Campylobacter anatolicus]MBR8466201.1 STAS-like domain-containing protein [Campylobacter anatolicus]